ncbi:MAG: phosphogluconate dehydrogenase (NADP(+)-dependent, decarboxylating) [Bacteroidetes bacterium HGW-Bacteroidetes-7]|jgi:6-phosphogluconate dehydrogenase|nr:MAG: phosphogluconate dehydrogenase (NADP(+)-dependent, decarboxylating) [Bacteroidetes bacterium HGW-Bacteroidetes-7]
MKYNNDMKSQIGVIGLAVMGENLVLNMESKGYKVSVFNRTNSVTERFVTGRAQNKKVAGFQTLKEFTDSLESPKKVMLMVRAGDAVDQLMETLFPLLDMGDIIIDGGNSNHADTTRRVKYAESKGFLYVGTGISGGEEGALKGPSIMPGGSTEAWPHIRDIFRNISAKAEDGSPCCEWIGPQGSGHFVKMVHNGIEYGDMQLIAEAYSVMKEMADLPNEKMAEIFDIWNNGKLKSYLIEISAHILKFKEGNGDYLIDKILDRAGQKGTGKLSVFNAMDLGLPLNLISTAVFERSLSYRKEMRVKASEFYKRAPGKYAIPEPQEIHDSLYASKLISYAQGFDLLRSASDEFKWNLNLASIARIWRNGCIIRSVFLNKIAEAFEKNHKLENLLMDKYFRDEIMTSLPAWSSLTAKAAIGGLSLPAFSSALNYFYSFTTEKLPANMIQAQRDYFGAHTFERRDMASGEYFHENWTGEGGDTSSRVYNV